MTGMVHVCLVWMVVSFCCQAATVLKDVLYSITCEQHVIGSATAAVEDML